MNLILKRWPSRQARRYVVVGLSVYGLEMLVIVASQQLGFSPLVAVSMSFWIGFVVSFGLQKVVTFGDKRLHHRIVATQMLAYAALVLGNFGFTLLLTSWLVPALPVILVRTMAIAATTTWNYYLYKTHIFNNDTNPVY